MTEKPEKHDESKIRGYLLEKRREKRRKHLGRSFFWDIFWYSGVYDYRILRILINFPLGFGISYAIYSFAWNRLNFADFDNIWRLIFQWTLITACALAYSISPVFRCATICAILGAIGKSGQGLLSIYVFDQVTVGPMNNILYNFETTSNIVVCHLEMQSKVTAQRITLATGPIEQLFEKHFDKAASMGQKFLYSLKALIDPLNQEIKSTKNEDEALAAAIDNAEAVSEREEIIEGLNDTAAMRNKHLRPAWTKFKSQMGRDYYRRMTQRCQLIYAKAVEQCTKSMQGLQKTCVRSVPVIGPYVCPDFNPLDMCTPKAIVAEAEKKCQFEKQAKAKGIEPDTLDDQMDTAMNISATLRRQLALNMHFKAIEEPRFEGIKALSEIKLSIKSDIAFYKVFVTTIKELISTFFVYFVYAIFRDTVQMISTYLTNIEFKNTFLTSYFWYIDRKRQLEGKPHLAPLTNAERKRHGLMSPFGLPTSAEIKQSWRPFLGFLVTASGAIVILLIDHYLYRILRHVVASAPTYNAPDGYHKLDIEVKGDGAIAQLLKDVLSFNFTQTVDWDFDNDACISEPQAPDWSHAAWNILGPLLLMLMLQVVFNFVIRRAALFFVVGYFFRKRSKARIVQLYNKLLFARVNEHRLARARIRCAVERRLLQRAEDKGVFKEESFIRRRIVDVLFKTGKCLLCEIKFRPRALVRCDKCTATYCKACYADLGSQCYACLAEEGAVNSQVTQLRGP